MCTTRCHVETVNTCVNLFTGLQKAKGIHCSSRWIWQQFVL